MTNTKSSAVLPKLEPSSGNIQITGSRVNYISCGAGAGSPGLAKNTGFGKGQIDTGI